MSIFSKIWKGVRKVAGPVIGGLIGGPVGAVAGGLLAGGGGTPPIRPAAPSRALVPVATRVIPGAGVAAGIGAAGATGLAMLTGARARQAVAVDPATGLPKKKRRRRRGITYTELKNHRRVEQFLQKNYKCKSGGTRGSYVRKRRS